MEEKETPEIAEPEGSAIVPAAGVVSPTPQDSASQVSAPDEPESVAAVKPGEGDASPPSPEASAAAKPPKQDWREARIARLTAQLNEYKNREREEPAAQVQDPVEKLNAAAIETRARELASQQVAIDRFNSDCAVAAARGKELFSDFDVRIADLRQLNGGTTDTSRQVAFNQMVAAAIETGAAPQILHRLGGDLDEAERILGLPPVKMAIELAKLGQQPQDTKVSSAPKPIVPISGRGGNRVEIDPTDTERADNLSTSAWMERRQKQIDAANAGSGRRTRQ